jgi:hypothetical protein
MRTVRALLYAILTLAAVAQAQPPQHPGFSERTLTRGGGVTIEADPADSAYVRALIARLEQPEAAAPADPQRFGIAQLRSQRDAVLRELAAALALPRPTPVMTQVYDKFTFSAGVMQDAMTKGRPGRYTLWRKPDLVARLRAGQQIPGFSLDGDDVLVNINASFDAPPDTPTEELARIVGNAWQQLVWPVNIGLASPEADIGASLQNLHEFRSAMAGAEANTAMTVLHEAVEATLVSQYVQSRDRRWFCEGVANHIALEVIRRRVGEERVRQDYDVDQLLAGVDRGDLLELEQWPVAENPDAKHYPGDLNEANYVRATWVIEQVARKHGPELLPKWMAAIGKTPAAETSRETIYAAYRQVTGEDLRTYLAPSP